MQEEIFKRYKHSPPHLFRPNGKYFITGATYLKVKYFTSDLLKGIVLECICRACDKHNWELEDWVILDNHYHLMLNAPENAESLSKMMTEIHVFASLKLRKESGFAELNRKIFHNYWDSCISFERSYYARLSYLYTNPVKHGYVRLPSEYEWGSYRIRYEENPSALAAFDGKYKCDTVKIKDDY